MGGECGMEWGWGSSEEVGTRQRGRVETMVKAAGSECCANILEVSGRGLGRSSPMYTSTPSLALSLSHIHTFCRSLLSGVIITDFSLQPLGTWLVKLLPVKLVPQWLKRADASHDSRLQTLASCCSGCKTDVMFAVIEVNISANLSTSALRSLTVYWNKNTTSYLRLVVSQAH